MRMTSTIITMRTTVPIPIYIDFPFLAAPGVDVDEAPGAIFEIGLRGPATLT
jgi:hypothetical protein